MTAFELIYLYQMKTDTMLMNTSMWIGITFAVVVDGYAAGKLMTRPMLWVLVVIYTVYTILNRYGFYLMGMQAAGIIRDIENLRANGQSDLNSLAAIPGVDGTPQPSASPF